MYDAILVLSFGGPEGPDDVIPFLENVLRGKNVPRERLLEVAEHYYHFGGISPINSQCRELIDALRAELDEHEIRLPIYWGNRNWHPMLAETLQQMHNDRIRRALCYITSGFSCYSGCRQYREDIVKAKAEANTPDLEIHKLRVFYNHPDFIDVVARNVQAAIDEFDAAVRDDVRICFTAHSIPFSMSSTSDYEKQLHESCRLVAEKLSLSADRWDLVYQSRSGRPQDPWLEPDICDHLRSLSEDGIASVVISPIGFLSDHMEVMYDLDDEARKVCDKVGITMHRAATPGHDVQFVSMIRKLLQERLSNGERQAIGRFGPNHDICPEDCCPAPARRPVHS